MTYADNKNRFYIELYEVILSNNIEHFSNLMSPTRHTELSKNDKEKSAFFVIYDDFINKGLSENFLKYIIFDYGISIENAMHELLGNMDSKVKDMFTVRDLNNELELNLHNKNSIEKKIKL